MKEFVVIIVGAEAPLVIQAKMIKVDGEWLTLYGEREEVAAFNRTCVAGVYEKTSRVSL